MLHVSDKSDKMKISVVEGKMKNIQFYRYTRYWNWKLIIWTLLSVSFPMLITRLMSHLCV